MPQTLYRTGICIIIFWLSWNGSILPGGAPVAANLVGRSSPIPAHVLIINSYHPGNPWSDEVLVGIRQRLETRVPRGNIHVEYLASKSLFSNDELRYLEPVFRRKYEEIRFSVVITQDDHAFRFATQFQDQLFAGAPIVFSGLANFPEEARAGRAVTGVIETFDVQPTVDLALRFFPSTKELFIILETSETTAAWRPMIAAATEGRPGITVHWLEGKDLTTSELIQRVSSLPPDRLILAGLWGRDRTGQSVTTQEISMVIAQQATAPIFAFDRDWVENGALGGKIPQGIPHGHKAGDLALQILSGQPANELPIVREGTNPFVFNYNTLTKFGVSLDDLPPQSTVLYRPAPGFYQQYQVWVWLVLATILSLSALTMALIFSQLRLRKTQAALLQDIQSREEAEEKLRQSEERLRLALAAANQGLFDLNIQTGEAITSPEYAKMLGYDPATFKETNQKWIERLHPDDREPIAATYRAYIAGEIPDYRIEFRQRTQTEEWKWILSLGKIVEYDAAGQPLRMLGTHTDITAQKTAEAERNLLVRAIEQSSETIMITDVEGKIQYVNPAFEMITGYSKQEAIGKTPRLSKSGKHDKAFYKEMWETISSGHPWQGQIINRTKDGRIYTEEARISPVKNHHGTISHYVAVKHDVSERIRLEEEGEKLRSQLHQAQKMEAVGRLAGGIAHDFNNMLQSIIGFSELTLSKLSAENPIQEYVSEILKAANRSGNLTRQLLAFSRKQKIQPSVLILDEAIQSVLKMLNRLIGENITVIPHLAASSQKIKIDPSQLDQILVNLAVNSRDAITGGGTITIETALAQTSEEEQTQYTGLLPGNYIRLTFKDDGCGIDPAILPHIFEPFFTTKEEGKGTGLGLAAIYGAVKQNNGFIYVNSEPGKGTRFLIYFPLYHGEDQPSPWVTPHHKNQSSTETILIVEDEIIILSMGKRLLEEKGFQVLTASTPDEALQIVQSHNGAIHLMIADIVMPGMNGFELADHIKALKPNLKIMFISGYEADTIATYGILEDGMPFLHKPFSSDELEAKVQTALRG